MLIEGCNNCANLAGLVLSFIACFILLVIAPLHTTGVILHLQLDIYHPPSVAYGSRRAYARVVLFSAVSVARLLVKCGIAECGK